MVLLLIDKLIELAFKMNKPIEDYTKIGCIVRFKGEGGEYLHFAICVTTIEGL